MVMNAAVFVLRCRALPRSWTLVEPDDFTMKAPMIEATMPTAAIASGQRNISGTIHPPSSSGQGCLTTMRRRHAARAIGPMTEPATGDESRRGRARQDVYI